MALVAAAAASEPIPRLSALCNADKKLACVPPAPEAVSPNLQHSQIYSSGEYARGVQSFPLQVTLPWVLNLSQCCLSILRPFLYPLHPLLTICCIDTSSSHQEAIRPCGANHLAGLIHCNSSKHFITRHPLAKAEASVKCDAKVQPSCVQFCPGKSAQGSLMLVIAGSWSKRQVDKCVVICMSGLTTSPLYLSTLQQKH